MPLRPRPGRKRRKCTVSAGTLYVVSTPIGNLGDLTVRAIEILRAVPLVLAEDTRHARILFDRYEIGTPTAALHEHNEAQSAPRLVARLTEGQDLALITDAGTPLLSDPGARLVRAAIDAGVPVVPVPGASALLAALAGAGLAMDRFTFFGFLPRKGADRRDAIASIAALSHVSVLYEAPGRVAATLADLVKAGLGGRSAAVARELTKRFEEFRRGTVDELAAYYAETPARGEVVIVVGEGTLAAPDPGAIRGRVRALRAAGMTRRQIVAELVAEDGVARNIAYRLAHEPDAETDAAAGADHEEDE
jgi:16S rRNA (cytidine1402-2'-O)-methyltransferase